MFYSENPPNRFINYNHIYDDDLSIANGFNDYVIFIYLPKVVQSHRIFIFTWLKMSISI